MHTISESARSAASVLAALAFTAALTGCAMQGGVGQDAGEPHRHGAAAGAPGPDGARMVGGHGASTDAGAHGTAGARPMDMQAMCAAHADGQGSGTQAAEHRAMMEQHMKDMSPEMRQRHMEMMRQHCGRRAP